MSEYIPLESAETENSKLTPLQRLSFLYIEVNYVEPEKEGE